MNTINLSDLTWNNMVQWPWIIKIGVILGINILIIALGYQLIISGPFDQFTALKLKESSLKADFAAKQLQASGLPAYRKQLQLMRERFGAMQKLLPTKNEMPGLLEDISKTGEDSGLKLELFAPKNEMVNDFYTELPIVFRLKGSYVQLATFFSRVAEMSRIATVYEFSIERAIPEDNKSIADNKLVMNITAKIYRYRAQ